MVKLKKWFEDRANQVQGVAAQINPLDGGRTYDTNQRGVNPGVANPNRPNDNSRGFQLSNNSLTRGLSRGFDQVNPLDNDRTWKNRQASDALGSVSQLQQHITNTGEKALNKVSSGVANNRVVAPIVYGMSRSGSGTGEGLAGLYDLLTPGKGNNRFGKGARTTGETADQVVDAGRYNKALYKGAQAGSDVATFFAGGEIAGASAAKLGQVASKLPGAEKVLQAGSKFASPATAKLASYTDDLAKNGNKLQKVAVAGGKYLARPGSVADIAADASLGAGLRANRGQDVSLGTVGTDVGISATTSLGLGALGEGGKFLAKKGVKSLRDANVIRPSQLNPREVADLVTFRQQAGTGAITDESVYTKGIAAAQKAGVDYRDPKQVDDLIGAHLTFDTRKSQSRLQPLGQGGGNNAPRNDLEAEKMFGPGGRFSSGQRVKAHDRGNIGTIVGQNEDGSARVKFTNRRDGTTYTKTMKPGEFSPTGKGGLRTDNLQNPSQIPQINQGLATPRVSQVSQQNTPVVRQGNTPYGTNGAQNPQLQTSPSGAAMQQTPQSTQLPGQASKPSNLRERGFIETVLGDENTSPEIKNSLSSFYEIRNTADLQTKAANLVRDNPDMALRVAKGNEGDVSVAVGSELVKRYQQNGQFEQAIELTTDLAKQLTRAGQTAQAASVYGKLTPAGILRFASNEIGKYNKKLGKNLELTPAQAKSLTDKAAAIQLMPEGRDKNVAIKQMMKEVYEIMPATWVQKVSTFQTMAQLLNPKTMIRNTVGNTFFGGIDNVSQAVAAPIDAVVSKIRGTARTTAMPQLGTQVKAAKRGLKEGYQESVLGVNLGPETQFELNDVPAFRTGLMGKLEKGMNISLRATDRAAYQAAFDDTVSGLMKANKLDKPTKEILEQAHLNGLYRTFQDDTVASRVFVGLKKALNKVGVERNGQKFGLGDFILKYPKTPGNLLARGLDYSPVGALRGIVDIARGRQQSGVNALARGSVGTTGIIGGGAVLGALGIITEKPEDDKDLRDLQKKSGLGGYQLNTSALKRFIGSGFNPDEAKLKEGDTLVSYDWAQPAAIPLSMGAAIGRKESALKGAGQAADSLAEGANTLAEQPLIKGVQQFFGGYPGQSVPDKLKGTAKDMPSSFIPTLSNQVGQIFDNTTRNTYDPNAAKEALNKVKAKIPIVSKTLRPQVDALGDNKEKYQDGSNNPFNVFLNPAFVSKYKPSDEAKLALDIFNRSGETQQAPRVASKTQKVNGQNIKMSADQNEKFQRYIGEKTKDVFGQLQNDSAFMALPDEEKAKKISGVLTDITKAAKIEILGDEGYGSDSYNPTKLDKGVKGVLAGDIKVSTTSSNAPAAVSYKDKYDELQKELNDPKNGLSDIDKTKKQKELKKLSVQKDYDNDTIDLYGMSKADAYDYVSKAENGDELAKKLIAYDNALYDAGLTQYKKYKNGLAPAAKGGKKGGKGKKPPLDLLLKGITPVKLGSVRKSAIKKVGAPKTPTFSVKTPRVATKKRASKAVTVTKTKIA